MLSQSRSSQTDANSVITHKLGYMVGGIQVCKDFFRRATGFARAAVNDIIARLLAGEEKLRTTKIHKKASQARLRDEDVLAFLDVFFKKGLLVDCAPEEAGVRSLKMTWATLFVEHYLPWCDELGQHPVKYNRFTSIRKKERPQYRKSAKISRGGYDHLVCGMCAELDVTISTAKTDEERNLARIKLKRHIDHAVAHRQHYRFLRAKATDPANRNRDISMIADAAGGTGSTFHPHVAIPAKDEPERHTLLKVKCTFTKIHGLGTNIVVSYPDLEVQGGNLVLECVYIAIKKFMAARNITRIRNLYLQLDNTNSNKCWSLFAGLAALIEIGVCQKVKVSYCVVGHTHEDIDAIIGTVITFLRARNVLTFAEFRAACIASISKVYSKLLDVDQLISIPSYSSILEGFCDGNINGISSAHVVRLTAKSDRSGINMHYQESCQEDGYYPRPIQVMTIDPDMWKCCHNGILAHPDPAQGIPRIIETRPLSNEAGRRLEWSYKVITYFLLQFSLLLMLAIGNIRRWRCKNV